MDLLIFTFTIFGAITGTAMYFWSRRLISKRTGKSAEGRLMNARLSWIAWLVCGAAGCGIIAFMNNDMASRLEFVSIYILLLGLSAVDYKIRKIPNDLLAALLVIRIANLIYTRDYAGMILSLVGLVIGFILFQVPSMLGINIGWGDVKLASVAGFCLGITGLFQSVLIMAAALGVYSIYIIAAKKGNMRTKVAIGPPLSMGIMISILFPVILAI